MEKTKIKTMDIKGKQYATVDSRVEFFREKYPSWSIETIYPVLELDRGVCVCRAIIKDDEGRVVSDGWAHEWQSKPGSMVNKTSYVENAQTSAVGRALGFLGIGINGMGIASADEVSLAIQHEKSNDFPIDDTIPEFPKEKHLSDSVYAEIMSTDTVQGLVDVYKKYANTEPVQELKDACALRRNCIEQDVGPYDN
jgi:hypothetical protein